MKSWPGPRVPRLPGGGRPLRLYDSATGEVRPTAPAPPPGCTSAASPRTTPPTWATRPPYSRSTSCSGSGGTPASTSVRAERHRRRRPAAGARRARRRGLARSWRCGRPTLFRADMAALRMLPPDALRRRGRVDPGDRPRWSCGCSSDGAAYRPSTARRLLLDVGAAPRFGYESHLTREQMLGPSAERGGDPDRAARRTRSTRLLWRARPAGRAVLGRRRSAPAAPAGTSSARRSRWTCSVTGLRRAGRRQRPALPAPRDVRGARRAAHRPVRRSPGRYVHAGMIGLDGEKMSKSRGNLVFVSRLRAVRLRPDGGPAGPDRPGTTAQDREWTSGQLTEGQDGSRAGGRRPRWPPGRPEPAAGPGARASRRRPGHPGCAGRGRPVGHPGPRRRRRRRGRPGSLRRHGGRPARHPSLTDGPARPRPPHPARSCTSGRGPAAFAQMPGRAGRAGGRAGRDPGRAAARAGAGVLAVRVVIGPGRRPGDRDRPTVRRGDLSLPMPAVAGAAPGRVAAAARLGCRRPAGRGGVPAAVPPRPPGGGAGRPSARSRWRRRLSAGRHLDAPT